MPWTGWWANGTWTPLIGAEPSSVPDGGPGANVRAGSTARPSSRAEPAAAAVGTESTSASSSARVHERRKAASRRSTARTLRHGAHHRCCPVVNLALRVLEVGPPDRLDVAVEVATAGRVRHGQ